nr:vacuolar protein sorting-associated protein 41 homolog [Tanacetum cinerariifolium]
MVMHHKCEFIRKRGSEGSEFETSHDGMGNAQRPEVHVVTWNNDELATDSLHVLGFEHYRVKDYSLAHVPFTGSSYAGGQWAAGDEPLYYVVSPKDVVIGKPRFDAAGLPLSKSTVVSGLMRWWSRHIWRRNVLRLRMLQIRCRGMGQI